MKPTGKLCPKALSPYAQALRQIALKGSVALGPTARETELKMYKDGVLPNDYRPPVQGKWDDTIERWAYAWQFPAEEDFLDEVELLKQDNEAMTQFLDFTERLLEAPPSALPGSGVGSEKYKLTGEPTQFLPPSQESGEDYEDLEKGLEEMSTKQKQVMPVEDFSLATNLPVAYLDDQSERSNASKELCALMENVGLEYTEEGLIVVVSALAVANHYKQCRALFDFICNVGLGPTAELYKCLMKYHTTNKDMNGSMALIEEMKEKGITPKIGNWHELMRCFYRGGDFPAVSQVVDNMKMYANIEPSEVTFALQLRALSKDSSQMNSLAESVQIFDQMENVNGFIASRPHYDALMRTLSSSPLPEMRLRCEELAKKMDLMGITWNGTTYLNLIRSAQVVGDVEGVEKYLALMRDNNVAVNSSHLSWCIQAHAQHIIRLNYDELKEKKADIVSLWLGHMDTCFGIYGLIVKRGWAVQVPLINALLRLCCQTTILCIEHCPESTLEIGKFEEQCNKIWNDTFDEWGQAKDAYSYECYIALLAHQQRIDEAEKLFQEAVLQEDIVPSRRTYECLIFMHLSSGEEGGAARALHYLEAMEKAAIPIRASLLKKIVRVNNASGYKRDMKRRARRIMQAREEYMAAKKEGVAFYTPSDITTTEDNKSDVLKPLPIPVNTTLAWWERWKKDTISKHELFDEENADGTPKGETFAEKK
ncbi:pentatricopeptidecontaining protein [Angomonas deanei]|uniref:Pentatricopeptide repeat domain containing protein, putative n=1 Tax=Angomonas deanei TaxID=59799 RepID=A0A7G2C2B5_9TRYP|nr:pentatricopeptidecontaining protein [Angomonas deanei]CAD2213341.1 Pentatricopeptide repeat domain containing protein, putative [Angomonas deanei]|eukprot:EPY23361.1 pentatricopeptidecontaining protein [Angomonas deanei]